MDSITTGNSILSMMLAFQGNLVVRSMSKTNRYDEDKNGNNLPESDAENETNNSLVQYEQDVNAAFSDSFTRKLYLEGLLQKSPHLGSHPVLSIAYGFQNGELTLRLPRWKQKRYQESIANLDKEKRDNYCRLFGSQYPGEAIVDGLPETVWLECVEPTLPVLKTLSQLKHRKCNLTIRKDLVSKDDIDSGCQGDLQSAPFLLTPLLARRQLRIVRDHLLALDAVGGLASEVHQRDASARDTRHRAQSRRLPLRPLRDQFPHRQPDAPFNRRETQPIQQRRRQRQHRPYPMNFDNHNFPNIICSSTTVPVS